VRRRRRKTKIKGGERNHKKKRETQKNEIKK
jgi:hypothetical protein